MTDLPRPGDQPLPVPTDGPGMHDLVIAATPDYLDEVHARVNALQQRISARDAGGYPPQSGMPDDSRALRAALLALTTAAERFLEPAHWTSPVRRGALADATREAWAVLGPPTKGDH